MHVDACHVSMREACCLGACRNQIRSCVPAELYLSNIDPSTDPCRGVPARLCKLPHAPRTPSSQDSEPRIPDSPDIPDSQQASAKWPFTNWLAACLDITLSQCARAIPSKQGCWACRHAAAGCFAWDASNGQQQRLLQRRSGTQPQMVSRTLMSSTRKRSGECNEQGTAGQAGCSASTAPCRLACVPLSEGANKAAGCSALQQLRQLRSAGMSIRDPQPACRQHG